VSGVTVTFFTEETVPEGVVKRVGGSEPRSGVTLTVGPIRIGEEVIEAFSIRT